jgi:hypothetical protein
MLRYSKPKDKSGVLSTSLQTDTTCLELSSIEDHLKSSDSCRRVTPKYPDPGSLGMTMQSPLKQIIEIDQDLEKTPAFKGNSKTKRKISSSCKKRRKELMRKSPVLINKNEQTDTPLTEILAGQEKVFNMKIMELCSEHDRKVKVLEERILLLKKDNERLNGIVEGKNAKIEVRKRNFDRSGSDYVKDYERLLGSFEELKEKNEELESKAKNNLCAKCKAFINANNDLKGKIGRIREFINND